MFEFRHAESLEKPKRLDKTSSAKGVYIRINVAAEPFSDTDGTEKIKYSYLEAFCTNEEFERFELVSSVQNKDVTAAQIEYDYRLDTPVEYTNGFTYKPKWAEEIYVGLLEKGLAFEGLFPMTIYDSTKLAERAVSMSLQDLQELTMFLAIVQQQYFDAKKIAELEE